MDGMTITEAPKRAGIVRRTEAIRNTWAHDMEENVDWTEALSREYWGLVIEKFRAGDRVEIHSFDHRIQFTMLVLHVNTASDPHYFDIAFLPVWPADLRLPEVARQRMPRYAVRQAFGPSAFNVVDTSTGTAVNPNQISRHSALEMAATLERGIASSAEQLAADFARHQAAVTSKPAVTPGAARTRRYRQRQRAEAAQQQGDAA
jgi:hypothetical protein